MAELASRGQQRATGPPGPPPDPGLAGCQDPQTLTQSSSRPGCSPLWPPTSRQLLACGPPPLQASLPPLPPPLGTPTPGHPLGRCWGPAQGPPPTVPGPREGVAPGVVHDEHIPGATQLVPVAPPPHTPKCRPPSSAETPPRSAGGPARHRGIEAPSVGQGAGLKHPQGPTPPHGPPDR